jgi:hypothetical protein
MQIFLKDPGASTSWNPQGLSRPVMGFLFTEKNTTAEEI